MVVCDRKVDQLAIDELFEANALLRVVNALASVVGRQPLLASVGLRLVEGEIYGIVVYVAPLERLELDRMAYDFPEVLFCLNGSRRAKTLVVFHFTALEATRPSLLNPALVVCNRKESLSA